MTNTEGMAVEKNDLHLCQRRPGALHLVRMGNWERGHHQPRSLQCWRAQGFGRLDLSGHMKERRGQKYVRGFETRHGSGCFRSSTGIGDNEPSW
jgi:hypothetical protein